MGASKSDRILVTGGDGFVGRHLTRALAKALPQGHEIVVGRLAPLPEGLDGLRHVLLDVTDPDRVAAVLSDERPTHLFHLAAIAAIQSARRDVRQTWTINFGGTLNLAIAVQEIVPDCRFLYCGSAQVYGSSVQSDAALDESAPFNPVDAYGASKAASDIMIGQMAKQDLRAIRLRPFNHIGPGQAEDFVVPAFAAQIAKIERGEQEPVIRTGNLLSRRDFLDVCDVVDAYARAVLRFDDLPRGCALNIASGRSVAIGEVLEMMLAMSTTKIEVREEAARVRSNDARAMVGDARLASKLLGWKPAIDIKTTLRAVLDHFRAAAPGGRS